LPRAEGDVAPNRVRTRVHAVCGISGVLIRVNSHAAEIVSKSWLEKGTRFGIEWLARRAQHVVDNLRYFANVAIRSCIPLQFPFPASIASFSNARDSSKGTFALDESIRHASDRFHGVRPSRSKCEHDSKLIALS
jgi:hypothetical protein